MIANQWYMRIEVRTSFAGVFPGRSLVTAASCRASDLFRRGHTGRPRAGARAAAKGVHGVEPEEEPPGAWRSERGLRTRVGHASTPVAQMVSRAKAIAKQHPIPRLGEAEDPAALADFLLSDAAGWMTGQVIGVDGGRGALAGRG